MKSFEAWLVESKNAMKAEINPMTVGSVLESYHGLLQEHSEKQPMVAQIGERVVRIEHLSPMYDTLLTEYKVSLDLILDPIVLTKSP